MSPTLLQQKKTLLETSEGKGGEVNLESKLLLGQYRWEKSIKSQRACMGSSHALSRKAQKGKIFWKSVRGLYSANAITTKAMTLALVQPFTMSKLA